MKYLSILITIVLCGTMTELTAQRICGSTIDLSAIQINDPARYQRIMQMEQQVLSYINNRQQSSTSQQVITIPVVVHVLHTGQAIGAGLNISDAQVQSQIDVLNEDFRRLNADRTNTPTEFQSVAADVEIEFVLACVDPDGNTSNGIVRVQTALGSFNPLANDFNQNGSFELNEEQSIGIKFAPTGSPAWPSNRYLNIWICKLAGSLLGYAQFPDQMATQPETDGVVIRTTSFGNTGNVNGPFDLGRTATHEVGHWLNLRHIWADQNNCNVTDLVADTPNQFTAYTGTPSHPQTSCSSNDMFMNYMDYTDDAGMNIFTTGQTDRMRALFDIGGVRESFVDCDYLSQVCVLSPTTTGSTLLCSSDQGIYTLSNVPAGAGVSWDKSLNLSIVSGQDSNPVTVQATSPFISGLGWVRASITGDCGVVELDQYDVWVGKPFTTTVNPDPEFCLGDRDSNYILPESPGADTYTLQSNSSYLDVYPTNPSAGQQINFIASQAGNYTVTLSTTNTCGTSSGTIFVTVESCGGGGGRTFTAYPNPAFSTLTIEETTNPSNWNGVGLNSYQNDATYVLYNSKSEEVSSGTLLILTTLDVSTYKKGRYVLKIYEGQEVESHHIVLE